MHTALMRKYILRWVKCKACGISKFTKEVIIDKSEVSWKNVNYQSVLELRDEN